MEAKTKQKLIFTGIGAGIGSGIGLAVNKFVLKNNEKTSNIYAMIIGLVVGGVVAYLNVSVDELKGEGEVSDESKKNKIKFTRV
jgi:hypothetical protein